MKKTVMSIAAIAALSHILSAQDISLDPLTVTSSAIVNTELNAPESIEIHTQKEIEETHVQNVYEFLTQQTSLFAVSSYGNPFAQKIDMHGYSLESGYQNIVIQINGRKINNIDMVPQLLASISPSSIERIEITKGSGVVTSGDGANAGVINIVTKQNSDKSLTLYGGAYGTFDTTLNLGFSDEKYALSVFAEKYHTDGPRTVDATGESDEQKMTTGAFSLALTPVEAIEVRIGAGFSRLDATYGGYLTLDEYFEDPAQAGIAGNFKTQEYETDGYNLGLSYFLDGKNELSVDVSREKKESTYYDNAWAWSDEREYDYKQGRIVGKHASDTLQLEAGVDIFDGNMKLSNAEMDKKNLAGYLTMQYQRGAHTVQAGYRYENVEYDYNPVAGATDKHDYDLHGIELGYNYTVSSSSSYFVSYAHAYQAPDLDRFFGFGWGYNPDIKPMETDTFTVGYNSFSEHNKFKLSVFYVNLEDEIYYDPSTWKNTNIEKSHKYGFDLYDKYILNSQASITLNYGYVRAIMDELKDASSQFDGNELPMTPRHNLTMTYTYLPNSFTSLAITQIFRSESYAVNDFGNEFSQKNDAYNTTNISITYAKDNYELFAKVNNLFNQRNGLWMQDDAIYPVDFTTTGIAGLKLKF